MIRHYLAVALRNSSRTKLYTAITVTGLAIAFGAAALIGLHVNNELRFERWIPNHDRIYQASTVQVNGLTSGVVPSDVGQWLASDFPQLDAVTRLFPATAFFAPSASPDRRFNEQIAWADANVFQVFRFPAAAGSLDGALTQPDSLVLTRRVAEKYFGAASAAVGKTLLLNGMQPMVVTAVLENLPSNTHLSYLTVIGAGHAEYSPSALQDRTPMPATGGKLTNSATYMLLKPTERIESVREGIPAMIDRHAPPLPGGAAKRSETYKLVVRPIRALHLSSGSADDPESQRYGPIYAATAIGLLIVLVAAINFINILTALGMRRALEVGVRKALGAQRRDLFAQFMTESFLFVMLAAIIGLGIARLALGPLNAFLGRTIDFSMLDRRIAAGVLTFLAATALLAGVYPSLVLSGFRPATVTKSRSGGRSTGFMRQSLAVAQFAVLISLLIATAIVYRQMSFGVNEALRQDTNPVVLVYAPCRDSLKNELARSPGVLGVSCALIVPQMGFQLATGIKVGDRDPVVTRYLGLDFGFIDVYGFELAAGRDFDPKLGTDALPADNIWTSPESIIVNETAARELGFANPAAAVGQLTTFQHLWRQPATFTPPHDAMIVGVVKDFQIGSLQEAIPPAVFYVDPANARIISLKLDGRSTPEALEAIDRVWAQFGEPRPIQREFLEQSVKQRMYVDLARRTTLFTVFAAVAVLIAVLGLVALAAHAAVSRTKEIGIRKALGGGRWAIVRLLLWEFSRPVLLANLLAWPAAYWAMSVWLNGFARRVELDWWVFLGAAAATLAVAMASVLVHTWAMARTRPVQTLRYE